MEYSVHSISAQAFPQQAAQSGAHVVTGTARRGLPQLVTRALQTGQQVVEVAPHTKEEPFEPMQATTMEGHTRAFVKIEDGCDRFCSYCMIPYARGRVRSKPLQDLSREIEFLAQKGFREVVLTGINLSSYGKGEGFDLLDGVRAAAAVKGIERVRLGSLEPDLTDDRLIQGLASEKKFCPQFHLSVQSGCDTTLRRMNRRYTAAEYLELCEKLRRAFDLPAITTDLMVGFAGETEEEFANTLAFLEKAGFAKTHVFPYSRRPGTKADRLEDQLDEGIKARRAQQAAQVADQSQRQFLQSMVGRLEPVLFERCNLPGKGRGHTPNGTQVLVDCGRNLRGSILPVRITAVSADGQFCIGELCEELP